MQISRSGERRKRLERLNLQPLPGEERAAVPTQTRYKKAEKRMQGQDYTRFTQRLTALSSSNLRVETVGTVNGYPIYRLLLSEGEGKRENILISAGVHGDEPAGPEAVLRFLERDNTNILQRFKFLILPCVNPYGYAQNTRENSHSIDINRSFAESVVAEVASVKKAIQGQGFDFMVDFHEDSDSDGFYLYEGQHDEQWIGRKIVDRVAKIGKINRTVTESDIPLFDGVSKIDPAWGDAGLAPYVLHFHSKHAIISETPTNWTIEHRVTAHLIVLDTVLETIE